MDELRTLVIYDIVEDRIRTRIADACLDFGLLRIQYSAFAGYLNRNKREELFLRLRETLGTDYGKILIQPVCNRDADDLLLHENQRPAGGEL
jgi:CRISPR-associated protein Cas2